MKKTTSTFIVLCASALALALLIAAGVSREIQAENTSAPIEAQDLTLDDRPDDSSEIITAWPWWAICDGTCKTEEVEQPVDSSETITSWIDPWWNLCLGGCKTDEADAPVDSSETIVSWIDPWWNLCLGGCKTDEVDAPVDSSETVAFGLRRPWISWPSCSIFCKNEEVEAPVSDVVANTDSWFTICWPDGCKTEALDAPVSDVLAYAGSHGVITSYLDHTWRNICWDGCKTEDVSAPVARDLAQVNISETVAFRLNQPIPNCWLFCKNEEVTGPVSDVLAYADSPTDLPRVAIIPLSVPDFCRGAPKWNPWCYNKKADTPEEPEAPEVLASDEFGGCLLNDEPIKLEELADCRSDLCFPI